MFNTNEAQQDEAQRDRERDPAFDEFFCEGCGEAKDECVCRAGERAQLAWAGGL